MRTNRGHFHECLLIKPASLTYEIAPDTTIMASKSFSARLFIAPGWSISYCLMRVISGCIRQTTQILPPTATTRLTIIPTRTHFVTRQQASSSVRDQVTYIFIAMGTKYMARAPHKTSSKPIPSFHIEFPGRRLVMQHERPQHRNNTPQPISPAPSAVSCRVACRMYSRIGFFIADWFATESSRPGNTAIARTARC